MHSHEPRLPSTSAEFIKAINRIIKSERCGTGALQNVPATHYRVPYKSQDILMFVCLQKDAKQCCDAIKPNCTFCVGHW